MHDKRVRAHCLRTMRAVSLLLVSTYSTLIRGLSGSSLDPKVTIVEKNPATRVVGSLSMPEGSIWCDGKPTYWLVGHQKYNDTPSCLNDDGEWEQPFHAVLDWYDDLNEDHIDRHDCVHIDVNHDGLPDVQCVVGANKGTGHGFNELYLTQEDGSLVKLLHGGGLQKYTTMRTRLVVTLDDPNGEKLMFIGVLGKPRTDGKPNSHRMFKNIWKKGDDVSGPYFEEVEGPWTVETRAECVFPTDINHDGLDDLILCNDLNEVASFFIQHENGTWSSIDLAPNRLLRKWQNLRVADVTGDGIPDLLVAIYRGTNRGGIHVFTGMKEAPFFDFRIPYFKKNLRYATPDLEILDINNDGKFDIYVVRTNEEKLESNYCGKGTDLVGNISRFWDGKGNEPNATWVPPIDNAKDVLFMATDDNSFEMTSLTHAYPGCGGIVEQFGDNHTLLLAQGAMGHPGYNLLLQWPA